MQKITKPRGYAIGQMSRETGVNIETIRYYERIGILPKPDRTAGGNRQYNEDQLKRLNFIRRSRGLGFSLDEIRGLFEMVDRKDFTCGEVHDLTVDHLASVRDKISNLKKLEKALSVMISECSRGDVPDCPILDTLFKA
ncbi:MAG: helix-turn-helix domain-containing protein [Rhodobacterales bacterium]|nr:helix-turn-helix domain-containing protein [Rhodobacterales bacterium]